MTTRQTWQGTLLLNTTKMARDVVVRDDNTTKLAREPDNDIESKSGRVNRGRFT